MLKKIVFASAALLTFPAHADVCSWNKKSVADEAVRILTKGTALQEFCQACGDTRAKRLVVESARVQKQKPNDEESYQVVVNNKDVDLAYLYILDTDRKTWRNLGLRVKCDMQPDDSPAVLKSEQVAG